MVAEAEMGLAAAPNGEITVAAPSGGCRVGLYVPLMDGRSPELPLYYNVGVLESLFNVAEIELEVVGDIRLGIAVSVPTPAAWRG